MYVDAKSLTEVKALSDSGKWANGNIRRANRTVEDLLKCLVFLSLDEFEEIIAEFQGCQVRSGHVIVSLIHHFQLELPRSAYPVIKTMEWGEKLAVVRAGSGDFRFRRIR